MVSPVASTCRSLPNVGKNLLINYIILVLFLTLAWE